MMSSTHFCSLPEALASSVACTLSGHRVDESDAYMVTRPSLTRSNIESSISDLRTSSFAAEAPMLVEPRNRTAPQPLAWYYANRQPMELICAIPPARFRSLRAGAATGTMS